jgi:hypothetical protein
MAIDQGRMRRIHFAIEAVVMHNTLSALTRKQAYSEGLWQAPVKPSKTADPPASTPGIGANPLP